jgi:hypothetical protein
VSFLDRPSVPLRGKIAFFAYVILSSPVVLLSVAAGFWGRCDSEGCMSGTTHLVLFPGLLIVVFLGAVLVGRWATKDRD